MNFQDHRLLSHYLLDNMLPVLPARHARAFIVGCLYPDRNYLTYFRGHTFRGRRRYTQRTLTRLTRARSWGLLCWFRFGALTHYLTDAFTFVHSPLFDGTLAAHVSYERRLHEYFPQFLRAYAPCAQDDGAPVFSQLQARQERYLCGAPSFQKDCFNIVDACLLTASGIVPAPRQPRKKRRLHLFAFAHRRKKSR